MRRLLRIIKWLAIALVLLIVVLLAPVAYVETTCRDEPSSDAYRSVLVDPSFLRQEANTYLTYPEWHIVYAYEGLANVLKTSDEHAFGYTGSVVGFWSSFCNLNRIAGRHGGADWPTRLTIHTIGVSFTLEMAAKAAYEADDLASKALFEEIAIEETGHKEWLELQLSLLDRLGEQRYASKYVTAGETEED